METTNIKNAKLEEIADFVNDNSEPYFIKNSNGKNCVILSETDWNSIKETAYLNSIPGYAESLIEISKSPRKEFVEKDKVKW